MKSKFDEALALFQNSFLLFVLLYQTQHWTTTNPEPRSLKAFSLTSFYYLLFINKSKTSLEIYQASNKVIFLKTLT